MLSVPTRAPNGVRVTSSAFTSDLLVQWNPLSQDYVNGKLLGYTIYYRDSGAFWWTPDKKVNTSSYYPTRFTLKDLKQGHRYRVRVAAFTSKGVGPLSYSYYATTGMCPQYNSCSVFFVTVSSSKMTLLHICYRKVPKLTTL